MEMRVDGGKGGGSQWPSAAGDASGHGGGDGPQVGNSIHSYTIDAAWMASMAGGAAGELGTKGSRGLRRGWRRHTPGGGKNVLQEGRLAAARAEERRLRGPLLHPGS